jgi:hypothetical protein
VILLIVPKSHSVESLEECFQSRWKPHRNLELRIAIRFDIPPFIIAETFHSSQGRLRGGLRQVRPWMSPRNRCAPKKRIFGSIGLPVWVNRVVLTPCQPLPVFLRQRTSSDRHGMSQRCHKRTHAPQQKIPVQLPDRQGRAECPISGPIWRNQESFLLSLWRQSGQVEYAKSLLQQGDLS